MDTAARDLACPELWQQSLERSLARRGKPNRSSLELFRLQPERDLSRSDVVRESLTYSHLRRSAAARRPAISLPGAGGISALALLAATTIPSLAGARGGHSGGERVAFRAGATGGKSADASRAKSAAQHRIDLVASSALTRHDASLGATTTPAPAGSNAAADAHVGSPRAAIRATSPSPIVHHTAPRHIALAHDAGASGGVSGAPVHALSGGAAPAASTTSAAARVPGNPQPAGHSSTGGGAVEDTSHSGAVTGTHAPAHSVKSAHTLAPSHPVAKAHPVTTTHPTTQTDPATTTHPTTTTHPVATTHTAPKPAAPNPAPVAASGYSNPLAGASVTPERIDQGVDYSGSGTLSAIGAGKVTYVGTSGTGWPGAFIEYQLAGGRDSGRYVYYAEGVSPAGGLHVGEMLQAGQPVARITGGSSSGIEIGWGSGVGTQPLAQANGDWSAGDDASNVPSAEGKDFSALIASLGGPPGKIEG